MTPTRSPWHRFARCTLLLGLLAFGAACSDPEPLRIGFLGGISGRVADLGIGGRNGVQLAIEMRNASGGINGRRIELLVEDDQQEPDVAKAAMTRLIGRRVEAVVGPMTSAMAMAVVPLANQAQVLLMSPTVTTTALKGKDDYFMRTLAPTTTYAQKSAAFHYQSGHLRRVAAIYDLKNRAYTESWLDDYRKAFEDLGGKVDPAIGFESSDDLEFSRLARQLLQDQPDSILILANSVDTALLAQQVRKENPQVRINTSEWAATERLIELGGKSVEGIVVAQFVDRESTDPGYVQFNTAYLARFGHPPGFAGLTGFDATNVVLDALATKKPAQSLKAAILDRRTFAGAQSAIAFDDTGDADRDTFLTTIRHGAFVRLR